MERAQVFVIDASIAVKWYVKEESRDLALRLRDDFVSASLDLHAPSLLLYEVGNALRYHPGSTEGECADAVTQLLNLGVSIHEPDAPLASKAASLAYKEGITFYDATYLALAQSLGAKLLTADRHLVDKLSQETKASAHSLDEYGSANAGAATRSALNPE